MPTLLTKYPGDQITVSFQYTFPNQSNFFLISDVDWLFNLLITSDMLYFGGITMSICKWSKSKPIDSIITPGILFKSFGNNCLK